MSPRRPDILGLHWDDINWNHVLEHILPDNVDELIEGGNWEVFRNSSDHPPERIKLVGRTPSGLYVTAILQPPERPYDGIWYPVTAWPSTPFEKKQFLNRKA